jgi:hypothetical protein
MAREWHYLSVLLRDVTRDVLARKITIEDATAQHDLPIAWIEAKILDSNFEPPHESPKKDSVLDNLRKPVAADGPRDALNGADQATKAAIKKDLDLAEKQKYSTHPIRVRCVEQAACEVRTKVLTPRAASEKFNVSVEDIKAQIENPLYAANLTAPLGSSQRVKQKITPSAKGNLQVRLPRMSSEGRNYAEIEIPNY